MLSEVRPGVCAVSPSCQPTNLPTLQYHPYVQRQDVGVALHLQKCISRVRYSVFYTINTS